MAENNVLRVALEEVSKKGYSSEELMEFFIEFLCGLPDKEQTEVVRKEISEPEIAKEITQVMIELGTPANLKGYRYIREGILYSLKNEVHGITKELYPHIARMFDTTSTRVERAIRHAIEATWERADFAVLKKYFGNTVSSKHGKPTNSEFIAMIADKLKLRYKMI